MKDATTPETQLTLISEMIHKVQRDLRDESFYYLLWGWLVFAASLAHYVLMRAEFPHPYAAWLLTPLGAIVTVWYSIKHESRRGVRSYVDELMMYVLIAFLVSLFLVLGFMSRLGLATYPMVMIVYGCWLFISGGGLRFRPLIVGGVINWCLAVPAFFAGFDVQLILLAAAVLLGYIIPGHMLRGKTRGASNELVADGR